MQEMRQIVAIPTFSQILDSAPFCNNKQNDVTDKISETDKTFLGLKANVDKINNTAIKTKTSTIKNRMFFDVMYSAVKYLSSLKTIKSK